LIMNDDFIIYYETSIDRFLWMATDMQYAV